MRLSLRVRAKFPYVEVETVKPRRRMAHRSLRMRSTGSGCDHVRRTSAAGRSGEEFVVRLIARMELVASDEGQGTWGRSPDAT